MAAHLFSVGPLAGVGLAHIVLSASSRGQWLLYRWFIAGAVAAVTLCGAMGMAFGIDFFFLGYSLSMSERAMQGFGANYRLPLSEWLFGCYRVLVPVALVVHAALLADFLKEQHRRLRAAALAALSPLLFYLVWDALIGGTLIQTRPYSALLLPCVLVSRARPFAREPRPATLKGRTVALACLVDGGAEPGGVPVPRYFRCDKSSSNPSVALRRLRGRVGRFHAGRKDCSAAKSDVPALACDARRSLHLPRARSAFDARLSSRDRPELPAGLRGLRPPRRVARGVRNRCAEAGLLVRP